MSFVDVSEVFREGAEHSTRGACAPHSQLCGLSLLIALATSFFPLLAQTAEKPTRNLLFIGQAKDYQHESISTAMATFYNLGRGSGLWNTVLRTD